MTEHVDVQRQNFVKPADAAKRVSYTPDYITRLAREGKIDAVKDGRQWLVDLDSLKLFSLEVEADKRRRQEALREERRIEKIVHAFSVLDTTKEIQMPRVTSLALLEATAVMICFVLFGGLLYSVHDSKIALSNVTDSFENVSGEFQNAFAFGAMSDWWDVFFDPGLSTEIIKAERLTSPNSIAHVDNQDVKAVPVFENGTRAILVPIPEVVTSDLGTLLADSFSDVVAVDFVDARNGTVTPVFRERGGSEHQFKLVQSASAKN